MNTEASHTPERLFAPAMPFQQLTLAIGEVFLSMQLLQRDDGRRRQQQNYPSNMFSR
jgi:hypothetical protein